ncbi:MAG TPA: Smr/MutS family protein [Vicinamibacterales bacterium]|nr:Smr/MutS family protein [Vicinamibacterales bacterium]
MPFDVPIERELDLHMFPPRQIPDVVDAWLRAAHEVGLVDLRLIHGRGRGVQRGIVQSLLEQHPLVDAFDDDRTSMLGATWVRLKTGDRGHGTGSR